MVDDHNVTQAYHPTGKDPELVREYTKMMSIASMVADYNAFRENHSSPTIYTIGSKDELLDARESGKILAENPGVTYTVLNNSTHPGIILEATPAIRHWINLINHTKYYRPELHQVHS